MNNMKNNMIDDNDNKDHNKIVTKMIIKKSNLYLKMNKYTK